MSRRSPELDQEDPPEGESEEIERMVALVRAVHHAQKDGRVLRAQHAKDTGCVPARFVVERDLPEASRRGVFATSTSYDAIIRFSNSSEFADSDRAGTARGMAIQLLGVSGARVPEDAQGTTQDFLLVDSPAFVFRAVRDYQRFFALRRKLRSDLLALLAFTPFHLRQTRNIFKAKRNRIEHPLYRRYWSMSPFRLGQRAVKFSAVPTTPEAGRVASSADRDATLVQRLATTLKQTSATFDFKVQFQTDPARMPIEDASIEWSEAASPFHKLATIEIPPQDLNAEAMRQFRASCEDRAFTPWHALADHRPLGGINRLRRAAYEASVHRRLERPS